MKDLANCTLEDEVLNWNSLHIEYFQSSRKTSLNKICGVYP